jgi:predicted transcriptional regulator
MADGRRARADQVARRTNTAAELLDAGMELIDATRELARRHRLSERQARRYVERARDQGAMEVPGPKVVFTVKLSAGLARRVRRLARATGQSISAVVSQALGEFLDRHGQGGGRG